jgi:hypothetical protein
MKLDDIPKKPIFDVPDGYFDQLPGKIQSRISGKMQSEKSFVFRYRLQYAIPVLVFFVVGALWLFRPAPANDVDSLLASVETEHLVAYLNESELTTEDVLEQVDFSLDDIDDIETEVYQLQLEDESFDNIMDDIDVENM